MFREFKYLIGLVIPLNVFISLHFGGWWSYFALLFSFGFIPLLESLLAIPDGNLTEEEELKARGNPFYDWLLYLNVPLQFALLTYFLWVMTSGELALYEMIGKVIAMGISCGVLGINVAHELGHRHRPFEKWMARALLMTSMYMHFVIEHNRGHHRHVSTPLDPATGRYGESLYRFFIRTIRDSYLNAWRLEGRRLRKQRLPVFSWRNEMVRFQVIQVAFLAGIFAVFGWIGLIAFINAAVIGFLLLETVNYIEHYGLMRKEIRDGVYEKVRPCHSWNSNHAMGRILLYELTRHPDHHHHAGRKYQVLRHHEDAPQMPTGYPGMILMAFFPPVWFALMHKRIADFNQCSQHPAGPAGQG